jgi:hypothetical protein
MEFNQKTLLLAAIIVLLILGCNLPGTAANGTNNAPPILQQESNTPQANPPDPALTTDSPAPVAPLSTNIIKPQDFIYLGAFRLPDDGDRPRTFAYGGSAMTFRPDGDPNGAQDGFPGSLFIMGHDRLPYGELANGNQVAEVNIPKPIIADNPGALNQAEFLQGFQDIAKGRFTALEEIPRVGMQYLDNSLSGAKIHITWGQHFQEDEQNRVSSHAWFDPDLSNPDFQGEWYLGQQSPYSINGYMLAIPPAWADQYTGGHLLGTGRFKDGGWSGMGPALFAYSPWDDSGSPAKNGTRLEEVVLLLYENTINSSEIEHAMVNYQHADEWEGAAWLTTPDGRQAVLFAGTKGTGNKFWYGFLNPEGAEKPCIFEEYIDQYTMCRMADGTPCPPEDLHECAGHTSERGWWSASKSAQFILYDPADLARVAGGHMQPWEPQPYASIVIDEHLLMNPAGVEQELLGSGEQRRYRIGDASFDQENGLLYVLELFADEAKPVVHVWQVK